MKNFFKKLSFVLAVAMVLTSLTPATASAASKNFVTLKGSKTAVTSVYAWIGGVTRNLDYNINGKTSGVKGTWKSSKEEFVKVDAKTGVITPVANGSAYVTFTTADGKTTVKTVVKARTRAAALHIYDKAEYAAGNKVQLENKEGVTPSAIELKVGETKDLRITMPLSKKQQEAGAKKASYFTYAEVKDDSFVTAEPVADGDERLYTLTAKAPGETTVTIVANQTTQANVRTGIYREAQITVKVVDAFSAEQTGTNQITVKGTDLSDKVADYSLKLGNATRALSKAEKKEDGSVVLTTTASNLTAGTYTLTFGDKTAEVICEASKVTSIVVEPEAAIMTASNSAVAYFKVLNQFGEDVTKRTNLSVTGTDVSPETSKYADGEVRFVSTSGQYNLNLTQLSLSIADRDSGVFFSKVLTVSEQSRLTEAEIKGVYKVSGNLVREAALEEGATAQNLKDYYLLVSGTDQYGLPFNPEKMDSSSISLTLSSLTGLTVTVSPAAVNGQDSNIKKVELEGKEYAAYPLGNNNTGGAGLKSGEVSVIGYVLTSGKQIKETITVGGNVKVASLKIYSNSSIYAGSIADLDYEALDSDGNSITDINVLRKFNTTESFATNGVFFVGSSNGVAKLKMDLEGFKTVSQTIKNVSWLSDTNVFGYTNLTILPNPVPVAVAGVWTSPETWGANQVWLATSTATDGAVTITAKDLKYEDQYGNIISYFDFDKVVSGAAINLQVTNALNTNDGIGQIGSGIATTATPVGDGSAVVVSYAAVSGSATVGTQKVTVASTANVNNVTRTSNRSFDVAAVPMKACSMTVSYGTDGNNFYAATSNNDVTGSALSVNVTYGDTRVRVSAGDDYTYSGILEVLNPATVGANATGSGKVLVILSGAGIVREAAYTTGNATPKVASSKYTSKYSKGYAPVSINASTGLAQYVEGITQYRNGTVLPPTISVSNSEGTGYTVSNNGKTDCSITFTVKGSYSINVTYYWEGGYTFTDTLYFRVK